MTRVLLYHVTVFGALAYGSYALALGIGRSRRSRQVPDAVAVITGVVILTVLAVLHAEALGEIVAGPRDYPAEPTVIVLGAFVAAAVVAIVLADTAMFRVPAALGRAATGAAVVALVSGVAAVVVVANRVEPTDTTTQAAPAASSATRAGTIDARFELPGGPLDIEFDGPASGYMSVHPDSIYRFELSDGADSLDLVLVADGLDNPRGLAIADGKLFATVMGPVLCPDPADLACRPDLTPEEAELQTIAISGGGVISLGIAPDGSLGPPERLIEDLPTTAFDHGVNALEVGPDGLLYATVGGFSNLAIRPDLIELVDHPNQELIGTVISFRPDGSDLTVYARGLRNAYDLTFTNAGEMYTADNNGEALNSLRREEILHVTPDAHFGYPKDGTFEPFVERTTGSTWILDHVGSAGVEWVNGLSGRDGLVIGALSSVSFAEFGTRPGAPEPLVGSRSSVIKLLEFSGYATTVDQLPDGRLLVGVFSPWDPSSNALLVVSVSL